RAVRGLRRARCRRGALGTGRLARGARPAGRGTAFRLALRLALRLAARRPARRTRVARAAGRRHGGRGAAAGVGAVEAATLEDDTHGVEDLAQPALALGADGQGVVAERLHRVEAVVALGAGVGIRRHGFLQRAFWPTAARCGAGTVMVRLPTIRPRGSY